MAPDWRSHGLRHARICLLTEPEVLLGVGGGVVTTAPASWSLFHRGLQPPCLMWTSQAIKQLREQHLTVYIQHFCQFHGGIHFSTAAPGTSDECHVCWRCPHGGTVIKSYKCFSVPSYKRIFILIPWVTSERGLRAAIPLCLTTINYLSHWSVQVAVRSSARLTIFILPADCCQPGGLVCPLSLTTVCVDAKLTPLS